MRGKGYQKFNRCPQFGITPAYAGKSYILFAAAVNMKDHPRLCGEKLLFFKELERDDRITPAYAGKRPLYFSVFGIKRDHPRLCGEKSNDTSRTFPSTGSPPPMRGKVQSFHVSSVRNRITPAYAGKRSQ